VPLATAPPVTAQFDAKELDARVRAAIDQLPPQAREIFLLRWSEQMTYAEIAAALGLAVKTVENHIGRALKVLRRLLEADRSDWG
jgi:RNA polymerase sigma-70 factor (ECF subfamily)